jgi:hypothetical protein
MSTVAAVDPASGHGPANAARAPPVMTLRSKRTFPQRCAALVLVPLLSGCVAAAIAVPAMTVAGVITRKPARPVLEAPPPTEPALVLPEGGARAELTSLIDLPPPTGADLAGDPWRDFASYALERGAELSGSPGGAEPAESALLSTEGIASLAARRRACGSTQPAVVIDLDHGPTAFSPESAGPPSPGLVEALARLREAGVVVLWISGADANLVAEVAEALRRTGLDPAGRDPLLLTLGEDDRKQTLREEANEDLCIVAIAGDQRTDFDELFDYLRNPDAAAGFEALIGSGWFVVPAPLTAPAERGDAGRLVSPSPD